MASYEECCSCYWMMSGAVQKNRHGFGGISVEIWCGAGHAGWCDISVQCPIRLPIIEITVVEADHPRCFSPSNEVRTKGGELTHVSDDLSAWIAHNAPKTKIECDWGAGREIYLTFDSERDAVLFKMFWQ